MPESTCTLAGLRGHHAWQARLAAAPAERRHELEAEPAAEHERESGGLTTAVELGVIDEIIDPDKTRQALADAIASADQVRGQHGNIAL
ncbi:MAG TPA: hypothetical protein VN695_08325 [Streptosporangiaceae bacterium]|nr:hypothetical protein [Streptosporangiaceae bacterium]